MIDFILGASIGSIGTSLILACVDEWMRRHAAPPEPQRVTPEDVKPLTDALASLARALRESRRYGAEEVANLAHLSLNLERRSRGLPPMAGPRLTDADVGPLLRRSAPPR